MPQIVDQGAATPGFLWAVAHFGAVAAVILILSGGPRAGLGALIALPVLGLYAWAFSRVRTLRTFGDAFMVIEPLPLRGGAPFTGTLTFAEGPVVQETLIQLRGTDGEYTQWLSEPLPATTTRDESRRRQVLTFHGVAPTATERKKASSDNGTQWRLEARVRTDRGTFKGTYLPALVD